MEALEIELFPLPAFNTGMALRTTPRDVILPFIPLPSDLLHCSTNADIIAGISIIFCQILMGLRYTFTPPQIENLITNVMCLTRICYAYKHKSSAYSSRSVNSTQTNNTSVWVEMWKCLTVRTWDHELMRSNWTPYRILKVDQDQSSHQRQQNCGRYSSNE